MTNHDTEKRLLCRILEVSDNMIINKSNCRIIDTKGILSLHDFVLSTLQFDRINKKMQLQLKKTIMSDEIYLVEFINVIGFQMSACDFWGASECILDFEHIPPKEQVIIPDVEIQWNKSPYPFDKPSYANHIETLFTFTSGDHLRIACEYIRTQNTGDQTGGCDTGDGSL